MADVSELPLRYRILHARLGYLASPSASSTTVEAGRTVYVSARERHRILPSPPTMKIAGQAIPFSASSTPYARMAFSSGSERRGKLSPNRSASPLDSPGESTEIATSVAPREATSFSAPCSSPSCAWQCGHQWPR